MDRIGNKNQKLIKSLIYIYFVFSLVYLFALGMDLKLNIMVEIIIVIFVSMLIKFFILNPLVLYGIFGISFLALILVNRFISPILIPLSERVVNLYENIIANLQGKENIASDNLIPFWIILMVLVSIYSAYIIFKNKSIYLLFPLYLSFFLYYWYTYFDEAYFMISSFLFIFFILMSLDKYNKENIDIKSETVDDPLYKARLKTVTNYSILIIFIAIILPKRYDYLEWPWLQEKISTTFPFVENLRYQNDYSRESGEASLFNFSITGFNNNSSNLGGPVILSNSKIMTVYSDTPVYLRGNVRHTYTGSSWNAVSMPLDYYSLGQNFSNIIKEEEKYFTQNNITITNHAFASTTIFSPYKATEVRFNSTEKLIVDRDNILVFTDGIYDGESYNVRVQSPLPYGMLLSKGINKKKLDLVDSKFYLQIPYDKITNRTKILVEKIVKSSKDDFEKAKAIENYLRNNYKYRLDVGNIPEYEDFVDYFLFEGKEGYCTYYATAMTVMLRLEGIPTRYVEGYLAHEEAAPNIYEISHKNAHAWVEAFIEPVGWMTFEPTPAYDIADRKENYQLPISEKDESINQNINNRNPRLNMDDPLMDQNENIEDTGLDQNPTTHIEYKQKTVPRYVTYIFISFLLLILPIRFLTGFLSNIYNKYKSRKWSINKQIIYKYNQIIKTTTLLGFPQEIGETHYEYAHRISYKFYSHNEKGIKEITEIFVKSKYSDSIASPEDLEDLDRYMTALDKRLRNFLGPLNYYYRKYVKRD